MAHETAHSIGGLGDEYERYTNKPNTSDTSNPDTIKWSKMLDFEELVSQWQERKRHLHRAANV